MVNKYVIRSQYSLVKIKINHLPCLPAKSHVITFNSTLNEIYSSKITIRKKITSPEMHLF